jgi:hypothetical protein
MNAEKMRRHVKPGYLQKSDRPQPSFELCLGKRCAMRIARISPARAARDFSGSKGGTSDGSGETVTDELVSCSSFVIKPRGVGFGRRSFCLANEPSPRCFHSRQAQYRHGPMRSPRRRSVIPRIFAASHYVVKMALRTNSTRSLQLLKGLQVLH